MTGKWYLARVGEENKIFSLTEEHLKQVTDYLKSDKSPASSIKEVSEVELVELSTNTIFDSVVLHKGVKLTKSDVNLISTLNVKSLHIENKDFVKYSGFFKSNCVEYVAIGKVSGVLDLSGLKALIELYVFKWGSNLKITNSHMVKNLHAQFVNPVDRDSKIFSTFSGLTTLEVHHTSISSLHSIDSFINLKNIIISKARNLEDISSVSTLTSLKSLVFDSCKKISTYGYLRDARTLERLVILNSAPLESFDLLEELDIDECFIYGTKVIKDNKLLREKYVKRLA